MGWRGEGAKTDILVLSVLALLQDQPFSVSVFFSRLL